MFVNLAYGSNRIVILTKRFAIKLPNIRCWFQTCWGLIDNMQERRANGYGKWGMMQGGICPLVFSLPGGFLNVMPRARPLSDEEWATFNYEAHCNRVDRWGHPYRLSAENKRDSFGVWDNRIVAVDYGN